MRMKAIVILMLFLCFLFGCSNNLPKISAADIEQIEAVFLETNESITLARDQIDALVDAYNQAKPLRNDVGTTLPIRLDLQLKNGSEIVLWGGIGDFCTIQMDGKQTNVKGEALGKWFDGL